MKLSFITQFTGKYYRKILAALLILDIASFITLHTPAEPILLILAAIALIYIAIKHNNWLFPLAMAEIISTSNGHSLNTELLGITISLRMTIFIILMIWTLSELQKIQLPHKKIITLSSVATALLLFAILNGIISNESIKAIYLDANGYLAAAYILAAYTWSKTTKNKKQLFEAIGAAATYIITKTLLFLLAFGHLHNKTLDPLYTWIRDTRLGEITLQFGNVYRIFLQSQWFIIPIILASASYILIEEKRRESGVRIILMLAIASIIVSLSRSFWVALALALIILLTTIPIQKNTKALLTKIPDMLVIALAAIATIWIIVALPIFQTVDVGNFTNLIKDRATQTQGAALDSRKQLLKPMLQEITKRPLTGHGLGKQITYKTSDPRWIETNNTNQVKTFAFEWGWLDIWLKFGILGILAYTVILVEILKELVEATKSHKEQAWIYTTLAITTIAIYAVHMFTPYLNHPIGWATLAIVIALLPNKNNKKTIKIAIKKPSRLTPKQITS